MKSLYLKIKFVHFFSIGEDQVHILEAFLEEAMTSGTSRLSSVAPSVRSGILLVNLFFGKFDGIFLKQS